MCGGSILRQTKPYLESHDLTCHDLTIPGWIPSEGNLATLTAKIKNIDAPSDSALVLDLFGNATFWYREFDDSLAMPQKNNSSYHRPGPGEVVGGEKFGVIVKASAELFSTIQARTKVVIPPPS